MILAILAVAALVIIWVVIGWGREERRREEARKGPPRPQPVNMRRAWRTATMIVTIIAAVALAAWALGDA